MPVIDRRDEAGFTMLATVMAMATVMLLAVVAVAAVNGDTNQSRRDLDAKRAFEAAKAGIDDYAYHLSANSGYWSRCTGTEVEKNALNQIGKTKKRLPVPGGSGAEYAIELIPATGQKECNPATAATANETMIESGSELPGSFRIRSNGFARGAKSSIVATFKPPSFLDYVYFTQRETLDPVTYGFEPASPEAEKAISQCSLSWEEGRYDTPIRGSQYCSRISFASGDVIKGPLHTNDAISISGYPVFGRSSRDVVEVGTAEEPGWHPISAGSEPKFVGEFSNRAPILVPPPTNEQLATIAQPAFRFFGQVHICLEGKTMTVGRVGNKCTGVYSGPIPSNGVVYVASTSCNGNEYSPFTAVYPETSGCGNAYVSGSYSGQLTIAAQNDVIIKGSLTRTSSNGLLGLIANQFVRLYHPFCKKSEPNCTGTTAETGENECNGGINGTGSLSNPTIDAAILAIKHSIIVDHYDCGAQLGTINVEGALAQKFRGPVGLIGSAGYLKNYVYDDRLKYQEPPSFIEPQSGAWVIGRETLG